ncbi:MAG: hypothetical protein V1723_03195 [Candidatus Uhrbacteria bacterium]
MAMIHTEALQRRWQELSIFDQLGNTGSEVHRTIVAKEHGDQIRFDLALARALELFDFTLADPRWYFSRKKEIARAREVFCEMVTGRDTPKDDLASLDRYFTQFGIAARNGR